VTSSQDLDGEHLTLVERGSRAGMMHASTGLGDPDVARRLTCGSPVFDQFLYSVIVIHVN
jgi:hypothetical protein